MRDRSACHPRAQRDPRQRSQGWDREHSRWVAARRQRRGRGEHCGDRGRNGQPRVRHDQARHGAFCEHRRWTGLPADVVRTPRSRLQNRRLRDSVERRAARWTRDDRRQGDPLRNVGGTPVRTHWPPCIHRRLLESVKGHSAISQSGGKPGEAVWPEYRWIAAERDGGGYDQGAQAGIQTVFPLRPQCLAGDRAHADRARDIPGSEGAYALRRSQRAWSSDLKAPPRVGVVGAGSLGFHHIRILRDLPGTRFAGFVETRSERAAEVEKELGVRAHASLADLLEVSDAVIIVVPTPAHFAAASEAIRKGKHVFIEKPITTTLEDARSEEHTSELQSP